METETAVPAPLADSEPQVPAPKKRGRKPVYGPKKQIKVPKKMNPFPFSQTVDGVQGQMASRVKFGVPSKIDRKARINARRQEEDRKRLAEQGIVVTEKTVTYAVGPDGQEIPTEILDDIPYEQDHKATTKPRQMGRLVNRSPVDAHGLVLRRRGGCYLRTLNDVTFWEFCVMHPWHPIAQNWLRTLRAVKKERTDWVIAIAAKCKEIGYIPAAISQTRQGFLATPIYGGYTPEETAAIAEDYARRAMEHKDVAFVERGLAHAIWEGDVDVSLVSRTEPVNPVLLSAEKPCPPRTYKRRKTIRGDAEETQEEKEEEEEDEPRRKSPLRESPAPEAESPAGDESTETKDLPAYSLTPEAAKPKPMSALSSFGE